MKTTIIGKNMSVSPAVSERVLRKTEKWGGIWMRPRK
jgi:ribosome-associated translation inhibitor RaiA